jgi:hypothetical protein
MAPVQRLPSRPETADVMATPYATPSRPSGMPVTDKPGHYRIQDTPPTG